MTAAILPAHLSAQLTPRTRTTLRILGLIALALVLAAFVFAPETAHAAAGQLTDKAKQAYKWLQIAVAFILGVAVLGSGVLAAFGAISWKTVGQIIVGCIVAGLAAAVVTALYGMWFA